MNKKWTIGLMGAVLIVLMALIVFMRQEDYWFETNKVDNNKEKGFLEGTVRFIGTQCPPEEISGRKPQVPPCDGPYSNYEITVYQTDGQTIVTKVISDADGNYKTPLNPRSYLIYTPNGSLQDHVKTNQVAIVSGQTTKLDLVVDTGVR